MRRLPIVMRVSDARMIRGLLASRAATSSLDQAHLQQLRAKLERALVLDSERVPTDVVTSQTRVSKVALPIRMDDGTIAVFVGYRV